LSWIVNGIKSIKDGKVTPADFSQQEQNYPGGRLAPGTLKQFYDRFRTLWSQPHMAHLALRSCNFGGDTGVLTSFGQIMYTRAVTAPDRPMAYVNLEPFGAKGPYSPQKFTSDSGVAAATVRIFTNPRDGANRFGFAIREDDALHFREFFS
jgi:hypothetical protein